MPASRSIGRNVSIACCLRTVAILSALGFPRSVAAAWCSNYRGFSRFLSWRGSIHPTPLENWAAPCLSWQPTYLPPHSALPWNRVYEDDGYMSVTSPEAVDSLVQAVTSLSCRHALSPAPEPNSAQNRTCASTPCTYPLAPSRRSCKTNSLLQ